MIIPEDTKYSSFDFEDCRNVTVNDEEIIVDWEEQ